jgi:hypothetical protein
MKELCSVPAITADMLPGILAKIARLISIEAALKLAHSYGGSRLYVPARAETVEAEHTLARIIGLGGARRLVEHFGGDKYDIPSARGLFRWREARLLRAAGKSHREIAATMRIGLTQARKLAASEAPPCAAGDGRRSAPRVSGKG